MKINTWILLICTYILTQGCEINEDHISGYYLNIDAPDLVQDNNDYYHMTYQPQYTQTTTTLRAQTGSTEQSQKLAWMSNKEINLYGTWTNLVNPASYTDDVGEAFTVLATWSPLINDTITVYCGYNDQYEAHFVDSLKVVIDE